jgi:signal transduction histidine kinase
MAADRTRREQIVVVFKRPGIHTMLPKFDLAQTVPEHKGRLLGLLHQRAWPLAGVLAVCLAFIEVVVDWLTWIEFNESIVYTLPLILAAGARNRKLLWTLTSFLEVTTFAVYYVQIPAGVFSFHEAYFVDRVLSAVTLLATALLLHAWTLAIDAIETHRAGLKAQNGQLAEANAELVRLRDEVTRQNQELDVRRQQAEDASSRKSRMLASVSHDIRSPLNAISLMAQVIRMNAGDPIRSADVSGIAERLQANVLSMADLVTDVLDLSSIDSGQIELHETAFHLDELLEEERQMLLPLAESRGLYLTLVPAQSEIVVLADRPKLARVIANLITNAVKFTRSGGISIESDVLSDGSISIRIRDTGIGIAESDQPRIFDEFSRVGNRSGSKGWGLGLAISKRLIGSMRGSLSLESEPGKGSTFSICLPRSIADPR